MMKRCMRPVLAGLFLACPALTWAADKGSEGAAPDLVISAGREGYAYWKLATRFKKVAGEEGLKVAILESAGSLENLERLDDAKTPVNLALVQSDALDQFLESHPTLRNRVDILESVGLECVFLITRADSPVETDADLPRAKDFRIAIPGAESGVAATYRTLSSALPGFAVSKPLFRDGISGVLDTLTAKGADRADAVMLVQRPKQLSAEIETALDHPEAYKFVAIPEKNLDSHLPEGQKTYSFMDVPLVRQGYKVERSVPTVCTKGLLVASTGKLTPSTRRSLERIVAERWMAIYSDEF